MARLARLESPTGYYHVIQRGMGKQILFESNADYSRYLKKLKECKSIHSFEIIGYCLMNNHVHLLLKTTSISTLTSLMHSIGTSYATYYNVKYDHSGAVFQSRFKSLIIENETQLLRCLRYIHNNPLKAGFSYREDYPYSSYNTYLTGKGLANTEDIMKIFGNLDSFVTFSSEKDESYSGGIIDDDYGNSFLDEGLNIISKEVGMKCNNGLIVKQLEKNKRNIVLRKLKDSNLNLKEIELLTGVSKRIIQRL